MAVKTVAEGLKATVDKIYVVNLESRPDRRQEMEVELLRAGFTAQDSLVEFFKAVQPEAPGAFPSIGARGCFLSHLGILRAARDAGSRMILLLEDDAAFGSTFLSKGVEALADLEDSESAIAYLGYRIAPGQMPGSAQAHSTHWRVLDPETVVGCTHAMLIHQRAIGPLVQYLEAMLERPAGHAAGGPMHVDGAYSWFRRAHPEMLTLVTPQEYVTQRASRSDITEQSWKEKLPFLKVFRDLKNRLSRRN